MDHNILTIADAFVEPPSEPMAFRTVSMVAHYDLNMNVLFHTTQDMKDNFYHWMKPRGLMDYISYILNEREYEDGVRIDVVGYYPNSIVTKFIRLENQVSLLGRIKSLVRNNNGLTDLGILL